MNSGSVYDLIFSCFNQYLFQDAKNNIVDLQYYFQTNPQTAGNNMIGQLIDAIKTYPLENIDEPLFRSILFRSQKTPQEAQEVMNEIIKWKKFNKNQIEPARQTLRDVVYSVNLQKANRLYADRPEEFVKYVKNINIQSSDLDIFTETDFTKIDINSIIAEQAEGGAPSTFEWINECFSARAYEFGQLGLIAMPPGVGKSLFMMQESLNFALSGYKVHYLALGDLKMKDFIIRLGAQFTGLPFDEVTKNLGSIYNSMCQAIGDKLSITILPAGKITVDEYIETMKTKDYRILAIDYDAGFKGAHGGEDGSMYKSFGDIYDKLTELTAMGKLVFILSQLKIGAYSQEVLDMSYIAGSSHKVDVVDFIMTRSKGGDRPNPNNLGVSTITKNRRGETNVVDYNIRLQNGRFRSLPKKVYEDIRIIQEKRYFTEADIDLMINNYNIQYEQAKQSMYKPSGGNNSPVNNQHKGPSPFGA